MSTDLELRTLERRARARQGDGGLQAALGRALDRVGRPREALDAYLRAAAIEPDLPDVVQALGRFPWWGTPRGDAGGGRALAVPPLEPGAHVVWTRPLGLAGAGIALDVGRVYVRTLDAQGAARLEALALHDGRTLWSSDDGVLEEGAAAPPLAALGLVFDAILVKNGTTVVLVLRARDGATGRVRWTREQALAAARPGAAFEQVALAQGRIVVAVGPRGRLVFEPIVRVVDAAQGTTLDELEVRGLSDVAADDEHLYLAAAYDRIDRRIEARRHVDGSRAWAAARGARAVRVLVAGKTVAAAVEDGLILLDRGGAERRRLPLRFAAEEALVATSRLLVGSWSRREGVAALDPLSGNVLWRDELPARVLAAAEGVVYALGGDGTTLHGIDLATGDRSLSVDLGPVRRAVSKAAQGSASSAGAWRLAVAPARVVGLTKEGVAFAVGGGRA